MKLPVPISTESLRAYAASTSKTPSRALVILQCKGNNFNPLRYRPSSGTLVMLMAYNKATGFHECAIPLEVWDDPRHNLPKLIYSTAQARPIIPRFEITLTEEARDRAKAALAAPPKGAGTRTEHDPNPHVTIGYPVKRDYDIVTKDAMGKEGRLGHDGVVLPQSLPPKQGLMDPQLPPAFPTAHDKPDRPQPEAPQVANKESGGINLEEEIERELAAT